MDPVNFRQVCTWVIHLIRVQKIQCMVILAERVRVKAVWSIDI
jgi:hypothetical protein